MSENLQHIIDNLDVIRQLYDKEVILSVMDREKGGAGLFSAAGNASTGGGRLCIQRSQRNI